MGLQCLSALAKSSGFLLRHDSLGFMCFFSKRIHISCCYFWCPSFVDIHRFVEIPGSPCAFVISAPLFFWTSRSHSFMVAVAIIFVSIRRDVYSRLIRRVSETPDNSLVTHSPSSLFPCLTFMCGRDFVVSCWII